jgi:hypothetical protein
VVPGRAALSCPKVVACTVAVLTRGVARAQVRAVRVSGVWFAALAFLELGAGVLGAALLGGPVVLRVVARTGVSRGRARASVVAIRASAGITCCVLKSRRHTGGR